MIPLQGYLLWQRTSNQEGVRTAQLERQQRTLTSLRQVVQEASSVTDLQQRFSALQAPSLGPAEQALPLNQLKAQLNEALEQADRQLQRRRAELPQADPLSLGVLILRNGFACLALAIGFAALGQRRRAPVALLREWQHSLDWIRHRQNRPRRRHPGDAEQQLASYVEQINRHGDDEH